MFSYITMRNFLFLQKQDFLIPFLYYFHNDKITYLKVCFTRIQLFFIVHNVVMHISTFHFIHYFQILFQQPETETKRCTQETLFGT